MNFPIHHPYEIDSSASSKKDVMNLQDRIEWSGIEFGGGKLNWFITSEISIVFISISTRQCLVKVGIGQTLGNFLGKSPHEVGLSVV